MVLEKTKTATTLITFFRAHKRAITFSLVAFCAFWLSRGALHRSYFLPYFAVFVTLTFSQLFWIGRVLDFGQRFIPGKPGRAWLAVIAAVVWVFFFRACNLNPRPLPYDPRLRQMLIDGAFSVWVVGSRLGFGVVMAFWAVERGARAARVKSWGRTAPRVGRRRSPMRAISESGSCHNAYCQDNEISWIDWTPEQMDRDTLGFVQQLIALHKEHPVFRRRKFFQGRKIKGAEIKDIIWLRPDGGEMTDEEWNRDFARCLGVALSGAAIDEVNERGQRVQDENFLLLMNAHFEEIPFALPAPPLGAGWIAMIDTSCQISGDANRCFSGSASYPLQPRSLALLVERASDRVRGADRRRNPAA